MGIIKSVKQLTQEIYAYELAEFEVILDAKYKNGFDYEEISLDIEYTSNTGKKLIQPAFLYKEYTPDENGKYTVCDDSVPVWRIRISPTGSGEYTANVILTQNGTVCDKKSISFNVLSARDTRGFLKVEPTVRKAFAFDNGEIFTAIGQNVCWGDKVDWHNRTSSEDLAMQERILSKMHKYKANWTRYWTNASWDTGFFKANDRTDDFTCALDRAARIDGYIELLRKYDMYSCMVFYYHGMFNKNGPNTDWPNCAFNADNPHGYLTNPADFFNSPRCKKEAKQYIRYMVARYGYSRNIFCWEFFNEVNFTDGDPDDIHEWHREMTDFIRSIDAHGHMVTTSSAGNRVPIIFDDMFDYINMHRYGKTQNIKMIMHEAYLSASDYDRPIIMEESGDNAHGIATNPITRHQQFWVGIMGNTPATAMEWFWDEWDRSGEKYGDQDFAYRDFAPVAEFAARIPRKDKKQRFVSYERIAFNHSRADALGYCGDNYAYIWFYDKEYRADSPEVTTVESTTLELILENGDYTAEWIDTYTGKVFLKEDITVKGRFVKLNTPEWSRDIALAFEKKK